MHIPDGFLDVKTAAAMGALSVGGLGLALWQAKRTLPQKRVPLLGLSAAFIFAAQMLNFPVAGGTSGHLIGGVLAAVLLGPAGAVIALSAVLLVQCFLFADGGVTALGANIFNMAIIGGVGGWTIYRLLSGAVGGLFGKIMAATFAAWLSTVLAAMACAAELAASGVVAWRVVFPAMAGVHMFIGVGEALIIALVLVGIARSRPELFGEKSLAPAAGIASLVGYGLIISLGLALFVSPYASSSPDGLDKTAQTLKFEEFAKEPMHAPMSDYKLPGISKEALATSLAGAVGTLVVFGLSWVLAMALVPRQKRNLAAES